VSQPIRPIFVFSILRSGSTLTQRIIAAHDGVATASEPMLLLPQLYAFRREGVIAEYGQGLMVDAIEDFCEQLPDGRDDYTRDLREFILGLYQKAAGVDARYFVDKSPPYHLIADDVIRLFPEGKFIFLWRNPLSIIASIVETWQDGRWHPAAFSHQLFVGLPRLIDSYRRNQSQAYSVRFEDIVDGDEDQWSSLMRHLGIAFQPEALHRFSDVQLEGRHGDPTGVKRYSALSSEPTQKWTQTIANPLRREWCRRYLRFLGDERLAIMGYDGDELLRLLDSLPFGVTSLLADLRLLLGDAAREPLRARLHRGGARGSIRSPSVIATLLIA
jgi:hypothetical protein